MMQCCAGNEKDLEEEFILGRVIFDDGSVQVGFTRILKKTGSYDRPMTLLTG
jgi:hypothetical protein